MTRVLRAVGPSSGRYDFAAAPINNCGTAAYEEFDEFLLRAALAAAPAAEAAAPADASWAACGEAASPK